jgi:Fe(3+) dicitrate transport protein
LYLAILKGEEDSTTADEALMIGTNDRRFLSYGVQTDARWETATDAFTSTLQLGVRLHADDVNRLHTEDAYWMQGGELVLAGEDTVTNVDSLATARALAAHIHEELKIGDLHVLPAIRVETIQGALENAGTDPDPAVTRTHLLPGIGALYNLGDWTNVFAGTYRGFSPVAPGQLDDVGPELSWNHEAGLRWFVGERHVEFVGFFNDYENITGACTMAGGCTGDAVDRQYNGGAAWIYGVETVLGDTILLPGQAHLAVELTYAFTQAEFKTSFTSDFPQFGSVTVGDRLPYVPEHQGAATLAMVTPTWALHIGATTRSGMLDTAGTFPPTEHDIPALFLLDAGGNLRLKGRFKLYAAATNLTGSSGITSWRPMGARPTAPFQIFAGVKLDAPQ